VGVGQKNGRGRAEKLEAWDPDRTERRRRRPT